MLLKKIFLRSIEYFTSLWDSMSIILPLLDSVSISVPFEGSMNILHLLKFNELPSLLKFNEYLFPL